MCARGSRGWQKRYRLALAFDVLLEADEALPVLVDYRLRFNRPKGTAEKVFKLKTGRLAPGKPLRLSKRHALKGNATTYTLHPGAHRIIVQVNGQDVAEAEFDLTA